MAGLTTRISDAVDAALAKSGTVAPVDVAARLGWLRRDNEQRWRQGRTGSLEEALAFTGEKLAHAVALSRRTPPCARAARASPAAPSRSAP